MSLLATCHSATIWKDQDGRDAGRTTIVQVVGGFCAAFPYGSVREDDLRPINGNLADYIVVTHAIDRISISPFSTIPIRCSTNSRRGGLAAALTAAVYHATGLRVRELPVHIEDLPAHAWAERQAS